MQESQIDTSTTERQLLYDIRTELRKNNELLAQLLTALCPIARDIETVEESKEDAINGTLPNGNRSDSDNGDSSDSKKRSDKRQTVHDKQHGSATTVRKPSSNSNSSKRVPNSSKHPTTNKANSKK